MGREFASAAARWVHSRDVGVRARDRGRLRRQPRRARMVRATRAAAAARRRLRATLLADRGRSGLLRGPAPPARRALHRYPRARASTCSARSRSASTSRANDAIVAEIDGAPRSARPLLLGVAVLPGRPGGLPFVRERRASDACSRSRSQFLHSSDLDPQKPINWKRRARAQRRVRLHGRPRHARAPPAAARRVEAGATFARSSPTSCAERPDAGRRVGALRHVGQRRPALRGARRRRRFPLSHRDEADRAGRDEHVGHRDRRHRRLASRSRRSIRRRCASWTTRRGGRRPGSTSTSARSRPTRRSPARSSSSASPTRSCRCGPRSSTSSRTAATACGSRSTARRRRRRPRRTGSSPRRSARRPSRRWSALTASSPGSSGPSGRTRA